MKLLSALFLTASLVLVGIGVAGCVARVAPSAGAMVYATDGKAGFDVHAGGVEVAPLCDPLTGNCAIPGRQSPSPNISFIVAGVLAVLGAVGIFFSWRERSKSAPSTPPALAPAK